jgi:hypothetical protein
MTLHPEVQKQAQAEIDAVVGTDRLPTLADREYLPFVDALVKEVFRWNPVAPQGKFSLLMSVPSAPDGTDANLFGYFQGCPICCARMTFTMDTSSRRVLSASPTSGV